MWRAICNTCNVLLQKSFIESPNAMMRREEEKEEDKGLKE